MRQADKRQQGFRLDGKERLPEVCTVRRSILLHCMGSTPPPLFAHRCHRQVICLQYHKSVQSRGPRAGSVQNKQEGSNRKMGGKNSLTRGKTDGDSNKRKRTGEIDHTVHCSTAATSSLLSLYVRLCLSLPLHLFPTLPLVHFCFENSFLDPLSFIFTRL